jgi:hypothetical protein
MTLLAVGPPAILDAASFDPSPLLATKTFNSNLELFLAVLLDVSLHCLLGVPSGVNHVAPRRVCMVCCFLVMPGIVMLGGFSVVPCGMREMF